MQGSQGHYRIDAGPWLPIEGPLGFQTDFSFQVQGQQNTAACYANCDNSTANPILNIADFICFLNRFSSGATYANCDNSTANPVLNIADFNCFLNKFTTGCS